MTKGRIEAFSDGVIAIIITIMVLELHPPEGSEWRDLWPLWPTALAYALSFLNVGIYWANHHHMFHAVRHVGGWVLWANLHLLFWLSLMPFTTGLVGEHHGETMPMALYAVDLMMCALSYYLLVLALLAEHGPDSDFARALGSDTKEKLSLLAYALSLVLAFVLPDAALVPIVAVALTWIVPDRRFARHAG